MRFFLNNIFLLFTIFLGLLLHLISAYYSIGFYSDDEHFQILEITAYLLGLNEIAINDPSGYYWEWDESTRMRPWLQPFIFYHFINFLKLFFPNDPFMWTLVIRVCLSLFGYLSLIYLFFTLKNFFIIKNYKFSYLIFFTFWFYPFLHSRTSSENLGLILFIFSFCILFKNIVNPKNTFDIYRFSFGSFLMGIAMAIKFTLVFTALPFFFWILIYRFNFFKIFIFGIFIIFALSLGLYIDFLHWGDFSNTYYQFYKHNLSSGTLGKMKYFGIEPWYYYITESIKQLAPVLSIFFVLGAIFYWLKNPKSIISWITFTTLIIFSFIGHKEIRYIFPIYFFAPFFIIFFFNYFEIKYVSTIFKFLIIFSNILFLSFTLFFPPNTKVGVYEYLYKNLNKGEDVYFAGENPYLINNMEPFFYTKFISKIKKIEEDPIILDNMWIVTNDYQYLDYFLSRNCELYYSTYPRLLINLNDNWRRLKLNWNIVYCK